MVNYVYYDAAEGEEPRLTFCWQTWLVWLAVVATYAAWHYGMLANAATRPVDWLGFGIHVTVVGLIALVGKTWVDIRNAHYGCDSNATGPLCVVVAGEMDRRDIQVRGASAYPASLQAGRSATPKMDVERPIAAPVGSSFAAVRK